MSEDRCVICGAYVPEGRMICPDCEARQKPLIDGRFCTPLIFEPSLTKDVCPMCKRPFEGLVEVVRCKDCKSARRVRNGVYHCPYDNKDHIGGFYCAYGERREEKTDEV